MSFQESIIIPVSLYKQCKLDNVDNSKLDSQEISPLNQILYDPTLSSDKKMKLYNQQKILSENKLAPDIEPTRNYPNDNFTYIIPRKHKPYANSIIDFMRKHYTEVGWDQNHRIRIGSYVIPDSNLGESIKHYMKKTVITKDQDIPNGTYELLEKLLELGLPQEWVLAKPRMRISDRIQKSSPRKSSSSSWISFK